MFETDVEYLKDKEEMYKKRGLKIVDSSLLLKQRYIDLKIMFFVSVLVASLFAVIAIWVSFGGNSCP